MEEMVVLTESDVPAWMALDSFAEFAQHINSDYAQATGVRIKGVCKEPR